MHSGGGTMPGAGQQVWCRPLKSAARVFHRVLSSTMMFCVEKAAAMHKRAHTHSGQL